MQVKSWPIDKIRPYPNNPRVIPEAAVDAVAASLKAYGFRQPIVVDEEGVVIVGHTRLRAAAKLGMDKVPVHQVEGWSEEQKRAYRLADNKTGEAADWDIKTLDDELRALGEMNFDLDLTGFDLDERQDIADLASQVDLQEPGAAGEKRNLGDKGRQIKVVLYAEQVHQFEAALKKAGEANRAQALMKICEAYLGSRG
ncbi:MAG: ParB N-terminal domain-containing protein [Deltaproteobacteria bacterium]|nr:ParB N-terminal domain-containing protein [Deltaproteobacteria bacterium]